MVLLSLIILLTSIYFSLILGIVSFPFKKKLFSGINESNFFLISSKVNEFGNLCFPIFLLSQTIE